MPPIDQPMTLTGPAFRVVRRAAVCVAMAVIVSGEANADVLPMPALSNVITRCVRASAATKLGGQLFSVPPNPMTSRTVGPVPTLR